MSTAARPSTDHQRAALMAALRHVMTIAGGAACFCHATRVAEPVLSKYTSTNHPDTHVPIDVALDADLFAGEPVVARALAAAEGYELVPAASHGAASGRRTCAQLLAEIGTLVQESADVVSTVTTAASDGELTAAEATRIRAEAHDVQSALHRLLAALDRYGLDTVEGGHNG